MDEPAAGHNRAVDPQAPPHPGRWEVVTRGAQRRVEKALGLYGIGLRQLAP